MLFNREILKGLKGSRNDFVVRLFNSCLGDRQPLMHAKAHARIAHARIAHARIAHARAIHTNQLRKLDLQIHQYFDYDHHLTVND